MFEAVLLKVIDEYIASKFSASDGIYPLIPMFLFVWVPGTRISNIYFTF
jgi:hypothetical protein